MIVFVSFGKGARQLLVSIFCQQRPLITKIHHICIEKLKMGFIFNGLTGSTEIRVYRVSLDRQMDDCDSVGQAAVGYLGKTDFFEQF